MKQRVTLTIDPQVSHAAKLAAAKRGTSVSGLVESLLARETGTFPTPAEAEPFSRRWAGTMKDIRQGDARLDRLKAKYNL
jgi:hypothetical protein